MKGEGEEVATGEYQTNDYCMTLRTSDMRWIKNSYVGVPASKRYGHTATGIGPHLIIIGGWDGGKPLSDVIVLRDRSVAEKAEEDPLFDAQEKNVTAEEVANAFGEDQGDGYDDEEEDDDDGDFTLET